MGQLLGEACRGGEVLLLEGDLGAGKTTLAQGVAAGLGVTAPVISPTFILLREYEGRLPLYHFDFYRLDDEDDVLKIGLDEYLDGFQQVANASHYVTHLISMILSGILSIRTYERRAPLLSHERPKEHRS